MVTDNAHCQISNLISIALWLPVVDRPDCGADITRITASRFDDACQLENVVAHRVTSRATIL
uniref:Uncharacterized protein n=1 Tax=Yersinia ruckeri TaxID=29486 RepID=A0A0A8VHT3_YERRU|nr:hypothetical protein CSF007_10940 [Yersinia ruckeri]